jgi:SAM-dependent methyltransferase
LSGARAPHWERVWRERRPESVSWYEPRPVLSLRLLAEGGLIPGARVLDVGGGASSLVNRLLDLGFRPGVLDISRTAVERARERLGERAEEVEWYVEDVIRFRAPHPWDAWHDRATFHFLIEETDRRAYREALLAALAPRGIAVIAGFGPEGPTRCSGLPVRRLARADLSDLLGPELGIEACATADHVTPAGTSQQFLACRFRRVGQVAAPGRSRSGD